MKSVKYILILLCLLPVSKGFSFSATENFDSANAAYAAGKYDSAIKTYEQMVDKGYVSASLYYNLGNAYFKTGKTGLAILFYEKARRLKPNDPDILANLDFVNQRTEDKIEEAPQLFLSEWNEGLVSVMSEKMWSLTCIAVFAVSLLCFALYLVSAAPMLRKIFFYSGLVLLPVTVASFFIAAKSYDLSSSGAEAILVNTSAAVNASPDDNGTRLFVLHEGAKVTVLQESGNWTEIRIANGRSGWVNKQTLRRI